jgi:hypothetical protein
MGKYIVTWEYNDRSRDQWFILNLDNDKVLHNEYFYDESEAVEYLNNYLEEV